MRPTTRAGARPGRRAPALRVLLAVLGAVALGGCASTRAPAPTDDTGRIELARQQFEKGKYRSTLLTLEQLLADRPGSRYVEEATYLMGRSYYEEGADVEAEEQFRRLLREFPGGEYAPEAVYYLGLTLLAQSRPAPLDQAETEAALVQFRSFVSRYPEHPLYPRAQEHIRNIRTKLADKRYRSGRVYWQRKYYRAARDYFESIVDEYGDTKYGAESMYMLARLAMKTGRWKQAVDWGLQLQREHPDASPTPKAVALSREAALILAQGFQEVEYHSDAVFWSNFVVDHFPDSKEAREARQILEELAEHEAEPDETSHAEAPGRTPGQD